jgi:murein DD-endopeptidase MepM/ murein hydrolase activator NlpD
MTACYGLDGGERMVAPIPGAAMTCEFGTPGRQWQATYHTGRDYKAEAGTEVRSTMSGTVVQVARDDGYGLYVVVETSGIRHLYAHLSQASVTVTEQVEAGQRLGLTGDGGRVAEPHLHYEERVSPYGYRDHRRPLFDTVGRDGSVTYRAQQD